MRTILFLLTFLLGASVIMAQNGQLAGKVTDGRTGEELVGAAIVVEGTTNGTITDFTGDFTLQNLTPGSYTFRCQFISYEPQVIPNVVIKDGATTRLDIKMKTVELDLQEVKVVAKANRANENFLLMEQKKAVTFSEAIGSQQLSAQGVSDAAGAASKITGIFKQEGAKTLSIRGLGDRYNATTLNGLPLPSNQAEYKNIELELFSSDVIEYVSVEKVYSPQLSGDFGGANINVVSKKFTGTPFFEVGLKTGANSNVLINGQFLLADGTGFWGFDNSQKPNSMSSYSFDNKLSPKNGDGLPNTGFSLSGGRSFPFLNGKINLFSTASYDNEYRTSSKALMEVNGSNDPRQVLEGDEFGFSTQTTGMVNLNYVVGKSNIYVNSLMVNSSSSTVANLRGYIIDLAEEGAFVQRSEFERTTMWVNQLLGDHGLGKRSLLDWGIAFNKVGNIMPDRRHNTLDGVDERYKQLATNDLGNNHRYFHDLTEAEVAANLNFTYKFGEKVDEDTNKGKITLGYSGRYKERNFEATQFNHKIIRNEAVDVNNLDSYFNNARLQAGDFELWTLSRGIVSSTYDGVQIVNGGYGKIEYQLTPKLMAMGGVRVEQTYQKITFKTVLADGFEDLSKINVLPSLTFKYSVNERANLRLGLSSTYTLPQFKESAPFLFEGITDATLGNPYLYASKNYHADLKWEWFPKASEMWSLAIFGKQILDPINKFVMASATNEFSYANTGEKAVLVGGELEFRKDIFSHDNASGNKKLSIMGNVTLMHTTQDLDKQKIIEDTEGKRPANFDKEREELQGSAPLLANAGLTYKSSWANDQSLITSLVYGYVSPSLNLIGYSSLGRQVDQELNNLDFVAKYGIKRFTVSLSAKNILNRDIEKIQENATQDFVVKRDNKGSRLSLGLTYKF